MKSLFFSSLSLLGAMSSFPLVGCANAAPAANKPVIQAKSTVGAIEKAGDKYMLPAGAGTKDGSSWANAMDATAGLQAGWDKLQAGQTLWIGSGNYPKAGIVISSSGEAGKLKIIAGKDTGGGAPVFTGGFNKDTPAKGGGTFISAIAGADFWGVQDIHVRDYNLGIASRDGGHEGVRIRNFDVTGSREGITLNGGATPEKPEIGSHDVEISDCEFTNYTKRGIRLKGGNYDFRITNCVADAGGKEWATEPFHMGFSVEGDDDARKAKRAGAHDHDITYTNCVALNNYHNNVEKYWNADGFCGERGVKNLTFINCAAYDNTDGGWDFKAENMLLQDCVAVGNKRNYRFWGMTTTLVRCLSADSVWPGGSGGDTGLWTNGHVDVVKSTFYNNGISIDPPGTVTVTDSIIARGKDKPASAPLTEKEGLKLVNTVWWDEASGQGENPQFVAPIALWEGQGDAFNNKKFGDAKGYINSATADVLPFHRTKPLVAGVRGATVAKVETPVVKVPKTPEQLALEATLVAAVENGGFENGTTGWAKAAAPAFQIKNDGAAEGEKYVSIATEKRVDARGRITGLAEGEPYTLTFRSRGNTSKAARLIVRKTPQSAYLASTTPAEAKEWTSKTLKFVAPANEITLEITVREAGSFDLDDVQVQRAK